MRRFELHRKEDVTGVSGTGVVAEGVEFSTGWVALTWLTVVNSLVFYPRIANVEHIHGHDGATRVVWLDDLPPPLRPATASPQAPAPPPAAGRGGPRRRIQGDGDEDISRWQDGRTRQLARWAA